MLNSKMEKTQKKPIEEEEKLKLLSLGVEKSPNIVIITDTKGNIIYVNQGFLQVTGYTLEEVTGKNTNILKAGVQGREIYRTLWNTIFNGDAWCGELLNRKKNGEMFWVSATISPVKNQEAAITHYIAIMNDITERKSLEVALNNAKKKAEDANRFKCEFIANMSHEIRTPLNGMIGVTELLFATEPSCEQRELLNLQQQSSANLLVLINQILDFSKIEANMMQLEETSFNLNSILERTIALFSVEADSKKLDLEYYIKPNVPSMLRGDPGRLRQIINNLVGNAVKFTGKGKVVVECIAQQNADKAVDQNKTMLLFSVRDTGIGIPSDKIESIFDDFIQADGSTTRKYGGTGLGLSISKKLVGLMGGHIWVESIEGHGSTFYFTSVFGMERQEGEEFFIEEEIDSGNVRILIIDNNAGSMDDIRQKVAGLGFSGIQAGSCVDAVMKMERAAQSGKPFAVVLMDCVLSEKNVFDLAKEIKGNSLINNTKIIVFVSAGLAGDVALCREAGISGYMQKSVNESVLIGAIEQVLKDDCQDVVTRYILEESQNRLHILLAEDSPINQKVAVGLLEPRGHVVSVVSTGKKAVEALEKKNFDLVLMDVQMPEMDGIEATRHIRNACSAVLNHNIPIIALTAHVMKGDRERFLEAGMNDYVSKPFNSETIVKAIEDATDKNTGALKETETSIQKEVDEGTRMCDTCVLNSEEAIARLGGDEGLLKELWKAFIIEVPGMIENLKRAVDSRKADSIELMAHSLKSSSATIGANLMKDGAFRIELASRRKDLKQVYFLYEKLHHEFDRVKAELLERL